VTHLVVDVDGLSTMDAPGAAHAAPDEPVRLLHGASHPDALAIRERGFRDTTVGGRSGVLVVEDPAETGWDQDVVVLAVDLPRSALEGAGVEAGPEGLVVPAGLLNRHGPPITVDDWSE
jgi:hypothetical protein